MSASRNGAELCRGRALKAAPSALALGQGRKAAVSKHLRLRATLQGSVWQERVNVAQPGDPADMECREDEQVELMSMKLCGQADGAGGWGRACFNSTASLTDPGRPSDRLSIAHPLISAQHYTA